MKEWIVNSYDSSRAIELSKKLNISYILSELLLRRGIDEVEKAELFLKKELNNFHSPFLMNDVEKGALLLINAIRNNKEILVWGDYDVDGVTSVTVLLKYIRSIGGKCKYYIPKRDDDGYGLNDRVINEYIGEGIELIITVDSGITAINEIRHAKEQGIDVIVTDHHECRDELPCADAVINPKRHDCEYPFKELAGVGVVFKFICAVEILFTKCTHLQAATKLIKKYSEFIAIGTIADVMPISDENRLIVSRGLAAIEATENKGLSALAEESGIETSSAKRKKISSSTVGFVLAPRINAAGRMYSSSIAVELFLTESCEEAARLAAKLSEINKERQVLENESVVSAMEKLSTQCDLDNDKILVLEDDNWHHGIIGIVSSRITEKFNLPSVLISFKNEIPGSDPDVGKGSARSIKGMNLVQALSSCADLLEKFGGHELAAGLSVRRSDLPEFRRRINEYARKAFENVNLSKTLEIDCEIPPEEITVKLANELYCLEPFGLANPVPIFAALDMKVHSVISIGDGKHTKLLLEFDGKNYVALMFGTPVSTFSYTEGDLVDVAFNIDINTFRNQQNVQMIIRDIRPAKVERDMIDYQFKTYEALAHDASVTVSRQDIPTRTDFAQIYTTLKELIKKTSAFSDTLDLHVPLLVKLTNAKYSTSIPLYKSLIILDVLQETGLIDLKESPKKVCRKIDCSPKELPQGKVILENAPTIKKLFSKIQT